MFLQNSEREQFFVHVYGVLAIYMSVYVDIFLLVSFYMLKYTGSVHSKAHTEFEEKES